MGDARPVAVEPLQEQCNITSGDRTRITGTPGGLQPPSEAPTCLRIPFVLWWAIAFAVYVGPL